jgi:hypothetical protein
MVYDYLLTLKKERRSSIDVISVLVLLLSMVAFLTVLMKGSAYAFLFLASLLLLFAGLCSIFYFKKKSPRISFSPLLLVAGLTWLAMPFIPWVAIPVLLLCLLEKPAKMPLEIGFTNDAVIRKNLLRKKISWELFNNVMLKDGILTLDFKNNRIFQKETIDENEGPDEKEFNEYCRRHLSKSGNPVNTR